MRKLLNKPWFVGLAALAAILLVVHSVMPKKIPGVTSVPPTALAAAPEATDPAVAAEGSTAPDGTGPLPVREMLKHLSFPKTLRDPFAPKSVVVVEAAPIAKQADPDFVETVHLSAVWIQKGTALVLLNGRILEAGEMVGRLKIDAATADGVWLTHWKGRDFLPVGRDFTLNTPAKQPLLSTSSL